MDSGKKVRVEKEEAIALERTSPSREIAIASPSAKPTK